MFFAVYQANSSRSACTRKGHGSNLVHARAFHTGYSQAHWGFSDCCFEVDKDIRQNTLWKTCARWCHHCWTRRNVALSRVKKNKLWIWKAYRRETGELIDWECGGRDKGTLSKLMERLSRWKVELFCTDNWGVYPEVIVADKLYQSKSQTVYLEQNNGRQRHWFARFRRKSIVVSKTLEMVDLTMALFARFHVNGSWKDIASLFSWHPLIFIGKFYESSGTPKVPYGGGVRYGRKGDKHYVAVDSYSALSETVAYIMKRNPQYQIECTVKKEGKETHGYVCAYESPCQEWELGLVVICLDPNF